MSYTTDFLLGTYVQCTKAYFTDTEKDEYYKINKYTQKSEWTPNPEYIASVEDIKPYNGKGSRHTHILHKDCWRPVTKIEIIENRPDLAQYITPDPQIEGVEVFSIKDKFRTDYDIKHVGGGLFKDTKGNYWSLVEISPYETTMRPNYKHVSSYDVILINHKGDNAFMSCEGYTQYMNGQYAQLVSFENLKLKYVEKNI